MALNERVTVTLPAHLVEDIGHYEHNRSRFIAEAVAREIARRRHDELLQSLRSPHPEAADLAEAGLAEWSMSLPLGDENLVDMSAGKAVCWVEGVGWVEELA